MKYNSIEPNNSIGIFKIGESASSLRKRLSILSMNVELKSSTYTKQLLESTIILDGNLVAKLMFSMDEKVIMIEYFNNREPLLYNDINIFKSSYKQLKKIGKRCKYDVKDIDMGFVWRKLNMGFFFEKQGLGRCPDSITVFADEYEEILEQSFLESEEVIDLSIVGDNEIKPGDSIGAFFLNESLFLVKFRFDKGYQLEVLEPSKKNNTKTKSCYIYKNDSLVAHLDFSENDKVECIKNYRSPLYYEGKNLLNESYYSLNEMGRKNNYVIEEIPEGFTWSQLGVSFYFKEKKDTSLPEAIGIHLVTKN